MSDTDFVLTVADVMRELGVGRATLWRWRHEKKGADWVKCPMTGKVRYSAASVVELKGSMVIDGSKANG